MVARTAATLLALLGAVSARPQLGGVVNSVVTGLDSTVVSAVTSIVDTALGGAASSAAAGATTAAAASPTDVLGGVTSAVDSVVATAVPSIVSSLVAGSSGLNAGGLTSAVDSVVATAVPSIASSVLSAAVSDVTSLADGATSLVGGATSLVGGVTSDVGGVTSAVGGVTSALGGVTSALDPVTSALVSDATSLIGSIIANPTGVLNTSALPTGLISSITSDLGSLPTGILNNLTSSGLLPTGILNNLTSSGLLGLPTSLPINATSTGLPLSNLTSTGSSSAMITSSPSMSASSSGALGGNFTNPFRPVTTTSRSSSKSMSLNATSTSSSSVSMVPTPTNYPSSLITFDGVLFLIEIDINYRGVVLDLAIIAKRDMNDLDNCLTTCAEETQCAATSFDSDNGVCTFYSSVDAGSRMFDNSTTFATVISRPTNSTGSGNSTAAESLICPSYNGHVITSSVGNESFAVGCGEFLIGTTFDITKDLTKRQAMDTGLPLTISNCVDICAISKTCVGTTFDIDNNKCSYYSQVDYAMAMSGFDSATKVANHKDDTTTTTTTATATTTAVILPPGITAGPGSAGTTTYSAMAYTTSVSTVYVDSPASTSVYYGSNGQPTTVVAGGYPAGATVTSMVAVGPTQYVNSIPTAAFAAPTTTVTVTVNNGGAAGAAGAYPTVTVHDCPAQTAFTTMYV